MVPPGEADPGSDPDGYVFDYQVGDSDEPIASIVEAIAELKGMRMADLAPIADTLDPDALNDLLESMASRKGSRLEGDRETMITFEYEGCQVMVEPGQFEIKND